MTPSRITWGVVLCAALAACSTTNSSSRIDYEKATMTAPLEVPPPMQIPATGPGSVDMPVGPTQEEAPPLLPKPENVRMQRAGDMRWLVVDAPVEQLWPRVREFLTEQGLEIKSEQAKLGILDTHWAENRADIPQNVIRGIISKVAPKLYGAPTRDRYRLRLERGELATTTEIYLSHYGLEQINHGDGVVWQPRPSDPELVSEMLSRLMLTLGVSEARAQSVLMEKGTQTAPAQFDGDALIVAEGFPRAWRLVGIALDRVGLVVEENDRSQGIYVTRQTEAFKLPGPPEEKGFFDLFGSKPEQERRFRLRVQGNDSSSRVTVVDEKGGALPPDIAKAILTRVQEQLH